MTGTLISKSETKSRVHIIVKYLRNKFIANEWICCGILWCLYPKYVDEIQTIEVHKKLSEVFSICNLFTAVKNEGKSLQRISCVKNICIFVWKHHCMFSSRIVQSKYVLILIRSIYHDEVQTESELLDLGSS